MFPGDMCPDENAAIQITDAADGDSLCTGSLFVVYLFDCIYMIVIISAVYNAEANGCMTYGKQQKNHKNDVTFA